MKRISLCLPWTKNAIAVPVDLLFRLLDDHTASCEACDEASVLLSDPEDRCVLGSQLADLLKGRERPRAKGSA